MSRKLNNSEPREETVVPKEIRFVTRGFVYRQFTLIERVKILLGFRALLEIHLASEHNPGRSQPITKFNLTHLKDQGEAITALRDQVKAQVGEEGNVV